MSKCLDSLVPVQDTLPLQSRDYIPLQSVPLPRKLAWTSSSKLKSYLEIYPSPLPCTVSTPLISSYSHSPVLSKKIFLIKKKIKRKRHKKIHIPIKGKPYCKACITYGHLCPLSTLLVLLFSSCKWLVSAIFILINQSRADGI